MSSEVAYPIFRGLQRPLEFMGLRGRYIGWAAGFAISGLVVFTIFYILMGFSSALISLVTTIAIGGLLIFVKASKGLHTKKNQKGIFIYAHKKGL